METYDLMLDALGDPTRRAVLENLRGGPLSVGEIARELPVTRPAVSQHLRILKEAGLVLDEREGPRRIYSVDPRGLTTLRAYLEGFWTEALANFKQVAESEGPPGRGRAPRAGRSRGWRRGKQQ